MDNLDNFIRLQHQHNEAARLLRGMVELIDHLYAYPKANPRKFFFLRGREHGNIYEARAFLAQLEKEKT